MTLSSFPKNFYDPFWTLLCFSTSICIYICRKEISPVLASLENYFTLSSPLLIRSKVFSHPSHPSSFLVFRASGLVCVAFYKPSEIWHASPRRVLLSSHVLQKFKQAIC